MILFTGSAARAQSDNYLDTSLTPHQRSLALLSHMTQAEKLGQLSVLFGWNMYQRQEGSGQLQFSSAFKKAIDSTQIGMLWGTLRADPWTQKTLANGLRPSDAIGATNQMQRYAIEHSRLGIPLLLAEECAHGLMAIGTTVFPTAIGQASSWDTGLVRKAATAIAVETRALGSHIAYGPVLDLAREPRWSRVEETYGEDSYLVAQMGRSFVRGLQGDVSGGLVIDSLHSISTLKHFVAYGVPMGGHNGAPAVVGRRGLYSDYLPPFETAIKDGGALSVMTAYNAIDGIPCTADQTLVRGLLKEKWGFNGFVVSDLGSISGIHTTSHTAADAVQAAAAAMTAGVDSDLGGYGYGPYLDTALASGAVTQAQLDSAVVRLLTLKFAMGLFERPYRSENGVSAVGSNDHQQLSEQLAAESIVLLKRNILPLDKNIRSIAVIGPNSDNPYNQLGDYTAPQKREAVWTVLDGIKAAVSPNTIVRYAKGCSIRDSSTAGFTAAIQAAEASDVVALVLGGSSARDFKTDYQSTGAAIASANTISDMENGEGNDRNSLKLLGRQSALLERLAATGKPIILILINGRPMAIEKEAQLAGDIIEAWYPGARGGKAIAQILFGAISPSGRLPISIPRSVGQLPVFYSQPKGSAGNYVEGTAAPLYPFGFGLSYSSFRYSDLKVSSVQQKDSLQILVSYKVTNTGECTATDVSQLYITDLTSSVVTPVRRLAGFNRISLKPGQSVYCQIPVDQHNQALWLWNQKGQKVIEAGAFRLELSSYAADPNALKTRINIDQNHTLQSSW